MTNKLIHIMSFMAVILLVTSCGFFGGNSLEKAYQLFADNHYNRALGLFEELIEQDPQLYEAWFGVVEVYLELEAYDEAEDTLKLLLDVLIENYDLEHPKLDYQVIISDFVAYVDRIIYENGQIGDWYLDIQPKSIDLYHLDFGTFSMENELSFEVPKDTTVYYTLDGRPVNQKSEVYRGSIVVQNPGDYTLTVAAFNDLGIKGPESYAIMTIVEGGTMPMANYQSGTYEGPITVYFSGFDPENQEVYFVTDGSNPEEGIYYQYGEGYTLYTGDYQIRAVIYNWETNVYSKPLKVDITVADQTGDASNGNEGLIKAPVTLEMVVYATHETIGSEVQWVVEEVSNLLEDITIQVTIVNDYDVLIGLFKGNNPPDLLYTWAPLAMDFYTYVGDVRSIIAIDEEDFYPSVMDSVWYWDGYYTLPITARPYGLLFYNQTNASVYYTSGIDYEDMVYEMDLDPNSKGITFPNATDYWGLMAYYHGYGGRINNEMGYITLDYQSLVSALTALKALADNQYINPYDATEAWESALYNGSSDFIIADPAEINGVNMSSIYAPIGQMPMSNSGYAGYPLSVDGLMVRYEITKSPNSDQAIAIRVLYDYLSNKSEYNSFIANASGAIPAKVGVYDEGYFTSYIDHNDYEALIIASPPLSIDLYHLNAYYIDFNTYVLSVMTGKMTPEAAATQIITDLTEVYLE